MPTGKCDLIVQRYNKDQKAGAARRKKGTWKDRMKGWIDRR
jgi:hypothetical protein